MPDPGRDLRLRRTPYVGVLAALTAALTAGYLAWSGAGSAFWTTRWTWGLLGAAVIGALLARLVSRLPAAHAPTGMSRFAAAWAGVVSGTAEGLLLSVRPVVVTWQLFAALGWTDGWQAVVAAVVALAASAAVIVVHHLGYREFRGSAMRSPLVGCSLWIPTSTLAVDSGSGRGERPEGKDPEGQDLKVAVVIGSAGRR